MISAASVAERQIGRRADAGALERGARADDGAADCGRAELTGLHGGRRMGPPRRVMSAGLRLSYPLVFTSVMARAAQGGHGRAQQVGQHPTPRTRAGVAPRAAWADAAGRRAWRTCSYEGYGPGGGAVMVECRHRRPPRARLPEVRHAFALHGGNLGADGSVSYLFNTVGLMTYPPGTDEEQLMQVALEAGAEDVVPNADTSVEVLADPLEFDTRARDAHAPRLHAGDARRSPAGRRPRWNCGRGGAAHGAAARGARGAGRSTGRVLECRDIGRGPGAHLIRAHARRARSRPSSVRILGPRSGLAAYRLRCHRMPWHASWCTSHTAA